MPLERSAIVASLLRKGFVEDTTGSHDKYWLYVGGVKQSIFTFLSRGTGYREYSDELLGKVARHLKLTAGQLRQLVDCTIDGPAYVELLRKQGVQFGNPQQVLLPTRRPKHPAKPRKRHR